VLRKIAAEGPESLAAFALRDLPQVLRAPLPSWGARAITGIEAAHFAVHRLI